MQTTPAEAFSRLVFNPTDYPLQVNSPQQNLCNIALILYCVRQMDCKSVEVPYYIVNHHIARNCRGHSILKKGVHFKKSMLWDDSKSTHKCVLVMCVCVCGVYCLW